jgi:hypothetical protein
MKKECRNVENKLRSASIIREDEEIVGIIEKVFYGNTLQQLEELAGDTSHGDRVIPVESVEMYKIIAKMGPDTLRKDEAMVSTKYKTVEKKVKPVAGPLPADSEQKRKEVSRDPTLRKAVDIGHAFTDDTRGKLRIGGGGFFLPKEEEWFREMLAQHGKAFAFASNDIGCVDPKIVEPMVIFMIDHVSCNLKPIPVPQAHIPKVIDLGILEPSNAPYSNRLLWGGG